MRNTIAVLLFAAIISHTYSVYIKLPNSKDIIHSNHKSNRHHYRRESQATPDEDQEYVNLRISAYKTTETQNKKRISVAASPDAEHGFNSSAANNVYETKVTYRPGPDFYADIFRIPISVLQAVSNFLGNNVAYVNSTTIQGISPSQSASKPKPLIISSLSVLPSTSTLSENTELPSSPSEAEDLSSTLPEIPEPSS